VIAQLLVALGIAGTISPTGSQQSGIVALDRLGDPVSLERRIRGLLGSGPGAPAITVPGGQVRSPGFVLAPGQTLAGHLLVLRGDAQLAGTVSGNVVVLDGNLILRRGAVVTGDALVIGGRTLDEGGKVAGELRTVGAAPAGEPRPAPAGPLTRIAGLAGVLIALVLAGFGLVTLARPRLEVVSDTVARSFFRSFLIGVLAQVIALPTAGLLVLGLVISIVGILLLPFVALVVPLLLLAAVLVGFLGAMHAVGEARVRRRMAAGEPAGSPNSYRYLLLGLGSLSLLWVAWIGFGWVPVAGALVFLLALIPTWVAATAGLGAFLLSRAGQRADATGRILPPEAMTDEYLWATPRYGVGAVKRPRP
jgi:hypothetical protein